MHFVIQVLDKGNKRTVSLPLALSHQLYLLTFDVRIYMYFTDKCPSYKLTLIKDLIGLMNCLFPSSLPFTPRVVYVSFSWLLPNFLSICLSCVFPLVDPLPHLHFSPSPVPPIPRPSPHTHAAPILDAKRLESVDGEPGDLLSPSKALTPRLQCGLGSFLLLAAELSFGHLYFLQ